ncbi:MAG: M6 family metalloprotease domain-containing protein [Candidatus Zixiibacteriota bacterium]|nr:MAG: M6 family metalloprotease domain-containing protein [candidate division Zixibacteria bacterium]
MTMLRGLWIIILGLSLVTLAAVTLSAMPPLPEAVEKWKAEGVWAEKVAQWQAFKESGGCSPGKHSPLETLRLDRSSSLSPNTVDTLNVIVVLVDFVDWEAGDQAVATIPEDFWTLLFSREGVDSVYNPEGSMTEFYLENSYGTLLIQGDVFGWYRMPQTYASYVGDNDGLGGGGALLATHAASAARDDPQDIDFTKYANGDAYVDGLIVVHAGPGAETGTYGIWSHQGSLSTGIWVDGVLISEYSMNPEEYGNRISTMGVFGHEYGHVLELPDLYDVQPDTTRDGAGLGAWSMMAGGSWNGNPSGSSPAHFDGWCKFWLEFADWIWLEDNLDSASIPAVQYNPVVYALGANPGLANDDFWLVENRQRFGFDQALPGGGLLVYHVDPSMGPPQSGQRPHYFVAVEQADGDDDLWFNGGSDAGDPFPGSTDNREFHTYSSPDSRDYDGLATEVGIWSISNSDSIMYADLDVYYSHPWVLWALHPDSIVFTDLDPDGNGNGIPEAGETISAYFRVRNLMAMSFSPVFNLSVNNPEVTFIQNNVTLASDILGTTFDSRNEIPIKFSLPNDFLTVNAEFTLTVTSNTVIGGTDSSFVNELQFIEQLGSTQVLLVDDDNDASLELRVKASLDRLRIPYGYHSKAASGTPTMQGMSTYKHVVWFTGSNFSPTSQLTAADVAVMKEWLDARGNLYLSSMTAAAQLNSLDPAFMSGYLHATLDETGVMGLGYVGEEGNEVGGGTIFGIAGTAAIDPTQNHIIGPFDDGQAAFRLNMSDLGNGADMGICGVTYKGNYRTVFTTFGFEFVGDGYPPLNVLPNDSLMKRVLDFFTVGASTDVDGDDNTGASLPKGFALEQNYPNPFNPTTAISYTVGRSRNGTPARTRLVIYNALGREVKTLVDKVQNPGRYTIVWDGTNASGQIVATGIYLYRLESDKMTTAKKMVFLK